MKIIGVPQKIVDNNIVSPSKLSRAAGISPVIGSIKIMRLGDSTSGISASSSVAYDSMAYGKYLQMLVRKERDDITWIGTVECFSLDYWSTRDVWCEAHSGYKIEELNSGRVADGNTGYPGWVAQAGQPDVVIVSAGTNNFSTDSSTTCITKFSALLDTIQTNSPNAYVVVWTPPTAPTTSPNDATRALFNANLLNDSGIVFISEATGLHRGNRFSVIDIGSNVTNALKNKADVPAYTHPNQEGSMYIATEIYNHLKKNVLPPAVGETFPRDYSTYPTQSCIYFPGVASSDYVGYQNNTNLNFGKNSFYVAISFNLLSLPSGLHTIISNGVANVNQLLICQTTNGACTIYVNSGAPRMSAVQDIFKTNTWQTLVLHGYTPSGDASANSDGILSLWIDGTFRYRVNGQSWNFVANDSWILGGNGASGTSSINGYVRQWCAGFGSSVPSYGSASTGMPIRKHVERWHYSNIPPLGVTELYPLDEGSSVSTSRMGGPNSNSFNGNASWITSLWSPWDSTGLKPESIQYISATLIAGTVTQASGLNLKGATIIGTVLTATNGGTSGSVVATISGNNVVLTGLGTDVGTYRVALFGAM